MLTCVSRKIFRGRGCGDFPRDDDHVTGTVGADTFDLYKGGSGRFHLTNTVIGRDNKGDIMGETSNRGAIVRALPALAATSVRPSR